MKPQELRGQIEKQAIIALDGEMLPQLLAEVEIIRADDTCVGGWIRILVIGEHFVVQEKIPGGDVLIRRLNSRNAAERFVERRLAAYQPLWDGCACRMDDHENSGIG